MQKFFKAFLCVLFCFVCLTGCSPKDKDDMPALNTTAISYNFKFIENNYPDYERAIRNSLNSMGETHKDIFQITNLFRTETDVEFLKYDADLAIIASIRAMEIAENLELSHTRPSGTHFVSLFEEYGITVENNGASEIIGWEYETTEELCDAWKNSPSHYQAMINEKFTKVGIGITITSNGQLVYVEEFM